MLSRKILIVFEVPCVAVIILYTQLKLAQAAETPQWDLLVFTQSWAITTCQEWIEKNPSHTCDMPLRRNAWTIHGIWPTKKGTIGPAFCNRTWPFDPEQVKSIENTLNEYWKNVEKETSTYSLWSHEWNKHGTCAAVLEPLNTQLKYFKQGLSWLDQYIMSDILSSAGIVPSDYRKYSLLDIHRAIKSRVGVDPMIECHEKHGTNYIAELRLCFDKSLKLADCDGVKSSFSGTREIPLNSDDTLITNCDETQGVSYLPQLPKNLWYIHMYKFVTWLQWFTL